MQSVLSKVTKADIVHDPSNALQVLCCNLSESKAIAVVSQRYSNLRGQSLLVRVVEASIVLVVRTAAVFDYLFGYVRIKIWPRSAEFCDKHISLWIVGKAEKSGEQIFNDGREREIGKPLESTEAARMVSPHVPDDKIATGAPNIHGTMKVQNSQNIGKIPPDDCSHDFLKGLCKSESFDAGSHMRAG